MNSIPSPTVLPEPTTARPQVSLWTILLAYLQIGLTAFGMAILQKLKALVMDNH
jgi:hypothetical protein